MVDGVRVAVHDSPDQIPTYVLREQGDWFEDEIRFLRRALQPDQHIMTSAPTAASTRSASRRS